jgi:hypothetical protein
VDRIVELVPGVTRDEVQKALTEQDATVSKFVALLVKEEAAEERKKEKKEPITIANASCKPGG